MARGGFLEANPLRQPVFLPETDFARETSVLTAPEKQETEDEESEAQDQSTGGAGACIMLNCTSAGSASRAPEELDTS